MLADMLRVWEYPRPSETNRMCEAGCDTLAAYVVEEWSYGEQDHDRGYYCQGCVPGQVALRL